jgi:hypothetical protein
MRSYNQIVGFDDVGRFIVSAVVDKAPLLKAVIEGDAPRVIIGMPESPLNLAL